RDGPGRGARRSGSLPQHGRRARHRAVGSRAARPLRPSGGGRRAGAGRALGPAHPRRRRPVGRRGDRRRARPPGAPPADARASVRAGPAPRAGPRPRRARLGGRPRRRGRPGGRRAMTERVVRIIGPGRAGGAFALALGAVGWEVDPPIRRGDDVSTAAMGVDLLVIATPDAAVAEVAAAVTPAPGTVVAHLAGSLGLDVLEPHAHRACIHPLVSIPRPDIGAARLREGAWFGVASNTPGAGRLVADIVHSFNGRAVEVADEHRATYHAAACIASNHLVALLAQAERVAATAGVPLEAFLDLVRGTVDNVESMG